MNNAFVYLVTRFFLSLWGFVRHWYVDGFWAVYGKTVHILEILDRRFALKITLRYFFKPLYQDYSIPGYIFGFFFRTIRSILAIVSYVVVVTFAVALYLFWAFLPFYILALGFRDQFYFR